MALARDLQQRATPISWNVESYTKTKPVTQSDSTITYGPFDKKSSFLQEEITVHFENDSKFLTVTRLKGSLKYRTGQYRHRRKTIDLLNTEAF